jgi:hypothetical protein
VLLNTNRLASPLHGHYDKWSHIKMQVPKNGPKQHGVTCVTVWRQPTLDPFPSHCSFLSRFETDPWLACCMSVASDPTWCVHRNNICRRVAWSLKAPHCVSFVPFALCSDLGARSDCADSKYLAPSGLMPAGSGTCSGFRLSPLMVSSDTTLIVRLCKVYFVMSHAFDVLSAFHILIDSGVRASSHRPLTRLLTRKVDLLKQINPLQRSGCMCTTCSESQNPGFAHTVWWGMWVSYESHNSGYFPNSINRLVFVTETPSVFCETGVNFF